MSYRYYYRDDDDTPLEKITALLVLSTKYDFHHIRTDIIVQISKHYPMSLNEYHDLDDDDFKIFGTDRGSCHFPLLGACLKADVDVLLPLLYYACSDYPMDSILVGAKNESIDPPYLITLVRGRDLLKDQMNKLVAKLPEDLRGGHIVCPGTKSCRKVAHFTGMEKFCNGADLGDIRGEQIARFVHHACSDCLGQLTKMIDNKRQQIWDEIPSYFGSPGWDHVKENLDKIR